MPHEKEGEEGVLQVVGALMHEIECILHEYLSFNWDRVDEVYEGNALYLSETGLKCLWKSNTNLQVTTACPPHILSFLVTKLHDTESTVSYLQSDAQV